MPWTSTCKKQSLRKNKTKKRHHGGGDCALQYWIDIHKLHPYEFLENPGLDNIALVKQILHGDIVFESERVLDQEALWESLCANPNSDIMKFVKQEIDKGQELSRQGWKNLSYNPNAISILKSKAKTEMGRKRIDWDLLSENPNALSLFEEYPHDLHWTRLSSNPGAIPFLEKRLREIHWDELSKNPNALPLLKKYPQHVVLSGLVKMDSDDAFVINYWAEHWHEMTKFDLKALSANPHAVNLWKQHVDQIHWYEFCTNPNPKAVRIWEKNLNRIDWNALSGNPGAIHFIKKHLKMHPRGGDKINWSELTENMNATSILRKYPERIRWGHVGRNVNAIPLLESLQGNPHYQENPLDWEYLSSNPGIFREECFTGN